jgi:hypothetical protein
MKQAESLNMSRRRFWRWPVFLLEQRSPLLAAPTWFRPPMHRILSVACLSRSRTWPNKLRAR